MALNRECMDKPYLIGRATAIVERLCNLPCTFASAVQVNPLQKLPYHLKEALKQGDEELAEVVDSIGEIPSLFVDAKGQFYIGYYHQKAESSKVDERVRIGTILAEHRQRKGLSIRQLAELCGVTSQNITKIEHGKYNVSLDILNKLCNVLECEIIVKEKDL